MCLHGNNRIILTQTHSFKFFQYRITVGIPRNNSWKKISKAIVEYCSFAWTRLKILGVVDLCLTRFNTISPKMTKLKVRLLVVWYRAVFPGSFSQPHLKNLIVPRYSSNYVNSHTTCLRAKFMKNYTKNRIHQHFNCPALGHSSSHQSLHKWG